MIKEKHILLFGAHVSISGGLDKAFERGESIGCTAIQIFTKSNRQWKAKKITEDDAKSFDKTFKNSTIKSVLVHASYLINIGSANKELNKKSLDALVEELERCELLNLPYLILHPGSRQESSEEECLNLISEGLNYVFKKVHGSSMILLENASGSGTSVGYTFEQLANIIKNVDEKNRLGICIDTCHAFAAGYNFSTKKDYEEMWKHFDNILGFKLLKAFHINDSKKECGSRIDRHAHIGKGLIGKEAFEYLFNDERFFDIPKVLETPYETINDYIPDIRTILELLSNKNKKLIKGLAFEKMY